MKKPIALFKFESDGFLTKQEQDSITEKIKETLKELQDNWEAVNIVAHALFKKKRLSYISLKKFICCFISIIIIIIVYFYELIERHDTAAFSMPRKANYL